MGLEGPPWATLPEVWGNAGDGALPCVLPREGPLASMEQPQALIFPVQTGHCLGFELLGNDGTEQSWS